MDVRITRFFKCIGKKKFVSNNVRYKLITFDITKGKGYIKVYMYLIVNNAIRIFAKNNSCSYALQCNQGYHSMLLNKENFLPFH